MKILAIVAHPDDESFFAGGTIAKMTKLGHEVKVVAMTDGVKSRKHHTTSDIASRMLQFHEACRLLGATPELWSLFPDQQADTVPQLSINQAIEELVGAYRPARVYTHYHSDLNIDHRRVSEAVLVATRGMEVKVLGMTPEWPARCVGPRFLDDSNESFSAEDLDVKISACLCYVDELRPYPHPRSEKYIREIVKSSESFMEIG